MDVNKARSFEVLFVEKEKVVRSPMRIYCAVVDMWPYKDPLAILSSGPAPHMVFGHAMPRSTQELLDDETPSDDCEVRNLWLWLYFVPTGTVRPSQRLLTLLGGHIASHLQCQLLGLDISLGKSAICTVTGV